MKNILLISLALRNFKGIREFNLDLQGNNGAVHGDNEVGKTTLFDAFVWLIFDKDSQNKKDFAIKTLDSFGNVKHGLEHDVTGVISINGRLLTLRKVYYEKFTKKRGSASQEFTGHTTDYYIDGVPSQLKEYKECVDDIVKEDIFKLLTSPSFFNEQLHWEKRRKILLDVCGDITDGEVIASNSKLAKLPAILGDRSIEDHRKVIAAKRKEINEELEKIPVRIDESNRSIPDTDGLDEDQLQRKITQLEAGLEAQQDESNRIKSGGEVSVKENGIREIQGEMMDIKNRLQHDTSVKVSEKAAANYHLKGVIDSLELDASGKQRRIKRNSELIHIHNLDVEKYRKDWHEANRATFDHVHDDHCSACGQSLPEDQVKAAHEKALENFNRIKSEKLEGITVKGKASAVEVSRLEQESVALQDEIRISNTQIQAKQEESAELVEEIDKLQASIKDVGADPQYIKKQQEIDDIQLQIKSLRESIQESVSVVQTEITKLRADIQLLQLDKAKFGQVKIINDRITALMSQEKELAAEFERLEQDLYLTEEFIRTKVSMLESKINSKFKFATFKLFEQQVNGGISEICETLGKGVPYSSGLNNAGRINIGLDIINTLSEHYQFSAPIWIDNAEAVTKLIDTIGQKICLVVSAADKKLRVENTQVKEAVV